MKAGLMRRRIVIEETTQGQNSFGEVTDSWGTFATRWARMESLQGREFWSSLQVNAERVVRFTMRYLDGVTPKMRVNYDSRLFNIAHVQHDEGKKRQTVLITEETV